LSICNHSNGAASQKERTGARFCRNSRRTSPPCALPPRPALPTIAL